MPLNRVRVVNAAHVFARVVIDRAMIVNFAKIAVGHMTICADSSSRLNVLLDNPL